MDIVHNESERAFETFTDGARSHLDYVLTERDGKGQIVFTHTFVAPEHRGKGVAAALVESGLAFARENGLNVVVQCSYVAAYLERHPQ